MLTTAFVTHRSEDVIEMEIVAPISAWKELWSRGHGLLVKNCEIVGADLTIRVLGYAHHYAALVDREYLSEATEDLMYRIDDVLAAELGADVWENL